MHSCSNLKHSAVIVPPLRCLVESDLIDEGEYELRALRSLRCFSFADYDNVIFSSLNNASSKSTMDLEETLIYHNKSNVS